MPTSIEGVSRRPEARLLLRRAIIAPRGPTTSEVFHRPRTGHGPYQYRNKLFMNYCPTHRHRTRPIIHLMGETGRA